LKLTLLRILTFRIAILGSFLSRLALNTPFFLLTLLLQIEFHFSAFAAGLFLMPYGLMMVATKPYVQKILHHYGFRRSLLLNPILLALLFLMFAQITLNTPAWIILLLVGLLGMSSSFQFTCMNALNFADVEKKDMSHASIISSVVQQLAMSFGVCFSAGLLIFVSRWHHVGTLNVAAFHTTFYLLSAVILSSLFIFRQLRAGDGATML
jgi:predicted MFS family arabinose efflux permease